VGDARRFRPIRLTSLTAFFGLAPLIFETSLQARFLVPTAMSQGFGGLFATATMRVLVIALPARVRAVFGADAPPEQQTR